MLDRQPESPNVVPPPTQDRSAAALRAAAASARDLQDIGRVRAVIDVLPEAVFVTESDGALRLTNPAADRLFADQPVHDRADLLSRFEEVLPDPEPQRPASAASGNVRHEPLMTVRARHQPNRWFALRTVDLDEPDDHQVALVDREHPGQTVFLLRDVTDTRELRPFREAFLAVLSHELRTPITTIYAGTSVLARRHDLSPPASLTLVHDISAEAARLYDLVEDLLVLARLERRALDPLDEPVLVQRVVDATIRTFQDRFGAVRITRSGDGGVPPVHGDATYVEQACRNLIVGAMRYAGPEAGQDLVVDVRSQPEAGEVTVAVLDHGPMLAPDELERAFELPDEGAVGRLTGAGIGPFVSRHLVEAMGGRVWAANRPEGGLEMGLALRIDRRDPA